jgi:hypothetical protein
MEQTQEFKQFKQTYKKSIIKKLKQQELCYRYYIEKNDGWDDETDEAIEIFTDLNFIKKIDNIDVKIRIYVLNDSIDLKIFRNDFRFEIYKRNLYYYRTTRKKMDL